MPRLRLLVLIGIVARGFFNSSYEEQRDSSRGIYLFNRSISRRQLRAGELQGIFLGYQPYLSEGVLSGGITCYVANETTIGSDCTTLDSPCSLDTCISRCNQSDCAVLMKAGRYTIEKPKELPPGILLLGENRDSVIISCSHEVSSIDDRKDRLKAFYIRLGRARSIIAGITVSECDIGMDILEMDDGHGDSFDVSLTLDNVALLHNIQGVRSRNEQFRRFRVCAEPSGNVRWHGRTKILLLKLKSDRNEMGLKFWAPSRVELTVDRCEFHNNKHAGVVFENSKDTRFKIVDSNFMNQAIGIRWEDGENEYLDISNSSFTRHRIAAVSIQECNGMKLTSQAHSRYYQNTNGVIVLNSSRLESLFDNNIFDMNIEYGIRILQGWKIKAVIASTNFTLQGLAGVYVLTEQFTQQRPVQMRLEPPFDTNHQVDIMLFNASLANNGLAGILTHGFFIKVNITKTEVSWNKGNGIYFLGNRTGQLHVVDVSVISNGNGILVDCHKLYVINSMVTGSSDGIKIFNSSVVRISKSKVFTNSRGIQCVGNEDRVTVLPWEFGHFVYMNMEFDIRCTVPHRRLYDNVVTCVQARSFLWILSVLTIASDIVLILPPVLHAKRVSRYGVSKTIARACVIALTMSWSLIAFLLWKLREATAESHRVGMMQTCLAIPSIGLISGLAGRVVTEFVTRRWSLMTSAWQHTEEEQELLRKQTNLQNQIRNPELLTQLATLHHQARQAWLGNDSSASQDLLLRMKPLAQREHERLGLLAKQRRHLYDEEVHRMACLVRIRNQKIKEPVQSDVPEPAVLKRYNRRRDDDSIVGELEEISEARRKREEEDAEDAYIEYIHQQAEWCMPDFCHILTRAVEAVNNAEEPNDLEKLGLLPAGHDFRLPFAPETHKLKPERRANAMGRNCALLLASIKLKERGQEKVINDYKMEEDKTLRPVSRYVCDWLRASVITEDPYTLAVLFAVLCHLMTLVRVKNNFIATGLDDIKATNMLANFELDANQAKHVVEIQFLLQDLYTIKFVDHRLYEVLRASSFEEILLKPIFHGAATVVLLDEEEHCQVEGKRFRRPQQKRGNEFLDAIDSAGKTIESISDFAKRLNPVSKLTSMFFESSSSFSWKERPSSGSALASLMDDSPKDAMAPGCSPNQHPNDTFSIELAEIVTNPTQASVGLPFQTESSH